MLKDFENDFFPNAKTIQVKVDILDDLWQALQNEFKQNDWVADEGIRYTLAAGLVALRYEINIIEQNEVKSPDVKTIINQLQNERAQIEGRYAVMKFRAYQFMQAVKSLEMQLNACKLQLNNLRQANRHLRQKLDEKP